MRIRAPREMDLGAGDTMPQAPKRAKRCLKGGAVADKPQVTCRQSRCRHLSDKGLRCRKLLQVKIVQVQAHPEVCATEATTLVRAMNGSPGLPVQPLF